MTQYRNAMLAGAAALALLALPAMAREGRPVLPDFATVDVNADGMVTPEELEAARSGRFDAADADQDGFLTRDELVSALLVTLPARRPERAQERAVRMADRLMQRADANGDGAIGQEERAAISSARLFRRADANRDGVITAEEAAAPLQRRDRTRRDPVRPRPAAYPEAAPVEDPAANR